MSSLRSSSPSIYIRTYSRISGVSVLSGFACLFFFCHLYLYGVAFGSCKLFQQSKVKVLSTARAAPPVVQLKLKLQQRSELRLGRATPPPPPGAGTGEGRNKPLADSHYMPHENNADPRKINVCGKASGKLGHILNSYHINITYFSIH